MLKPAIESKNDLSRTELTLVRLFLFVAFGISAYLAWNSFKGGGVIGCGPESDCDKVLGSRWAYVFGLPVSAVALPVYASLIWCSLQRTLRWKLMVPLAATVLLAAFWFVGLQVFAIKAFCKFCMVAHSAGLIASVIILGRNPVPAPILLRSAGAAAGLVSLLAISQFVSQPPAPIQVALPAQPAGATNIATRMPSNAPVAAITNTVLPAALPDPTYSLMQGQFILNLTKVPVTGSPHAAKKLVKLFDYTCHHCRDLYQLLGPVKKKYSNELAIISLPMPLDASCNPVLRSTQPAHTNACEYARISLAVFLAQPSQFEPFSHWVFTPDRPPDIHSTRAYAEQLVGSAALATAMANPWIGEQIKTNGQIYQTSSRIARRGAMPQMIFDGGVSVGAVRNAEQLDKILYDGIRLGTPPAVKNP